MSTNCSESAPCADVNGATLTVPARESGGKPPDRPCRLRGGMRPARPGCPRLAFSGLSQRSGAVVERGRFGAAFAGILIAAVLSCTAGPAAAQTTTTTYVSNTGQGNNQQTSSRSVYAQNFTTGPTECGYLLSTVEFVRSVGIPGTPALSVSVCSVDEDAEPIAPCTALNPLGSFAEASLLFTAPTVVSILRQSPAFSPTHADGHDLRVRRPPRLSALDPQGRRVSIHPRQGISVCSHRCSPLPPSANSHGNRCLNDVGGEGSARRGRIQCIDDGEAGATS